MKGVLAWFAENRVAANLLMGSIAVIGLLAVPYAMVEVFPEASADRVTVAVAYPGAAPEEVEASICVRIEEAIWDVDGIEEITSTSAEGGGTVTVEVRTDANTRDVLDDVKARVDAIDTFPEEAERPVVQELILRRPVVDVALYGPSDEASLKHLAERVRDELAALEHISQVEVVGTRPYEIAIELREDDLRQNGLSIDEVVAAVRESSLDLPAGALQTRSGEILLRTVSQAYTGAEYAEILLRTRPDGSRVLLGDVANVVDGFAETDQSSRFDGQPSAQVRVYRVGRQNALEVAEAVRTWVQGARARLPEGIQVTTWRDESVILAGRLELMVRNGLGGLALVFVVLALFLRFRLAFWVSLGIPVSFLGGLAVMHQAGGSINLISLFALILVLGIVVDDAIVVGESVHREQEEGEPGLVGAVRGVRDVARPVVFAVLTTVAAFLPMAFLEGFVGRIWAIIPLVVVPVLLFSLVESLLILPAHLAHTPAWMERSVRHFPFSWWRRFQDVFAKGLVGFARHVYRPFLELCLRWRYATLAAAVTALLLTVGLVAGGRIRFVFQPAVEADNVVAQLELPLGTPLERTSEVVARVEAAVEILRAEIDAMDPPDEEGSKLRHVFTSLGSQPFLADQQRNASLLASNSGGAHLAEVNLELAPSERRNFASSWVAGRWRELVGDIPGAVAFDVNSDLISAGKAVHVRLASSSLDELLTASDRVRAELAALPGTQSIQTSWRVGKQELRLELLPEGEAAGLRQRDLALAVRGAFYGAEAQRIQRGRDEIKVMVRYPRDDRASLDALDNLRVRTPDGRELPFTAVARAELGRGFASIQRASRSRTVDVTAELDPEAAEAAGIGPTDLRVALSERVLPALAADLPGLSFSFEGEQQEQSRTLEQLAILYLLALFGIYALMAVPFRSYVQPLIVMLAVPFGAVGAILGHALLGYDFSIVSLLGLVALSGVVVNDSLVLVDYVNRHRDRGLGALEAAAEAGQLRFRPILLTSLTTFAGLTPLMLERSLQAQFMIPMAISLAFGVMFATAISLVLVPAAYGVLADLGRAGKWLLGAAPEPQTAQQA